MTIDERLYNAFTSREFATDTQEQRVRGMESLQTLFKSAFRASPEGTKVRRLLVKAMHPMQPSVLEGGTNDSASIGLREGRREVVSAIFRLSSSVDEEV